MAIISRNLAIATVQMMKLILVTAYLSLERKYQ